MHTLDVYHVFSIRSEIKWNSFFRDSLEHQAFRLQYSPYNLHNYIVIILNPILIEHNPVNKSREICVNWWCYLRRLQHMKLLLLVLMVWFTMEMIPTVEERHRWLVAEGGGVRGEGVDFQLWECMEVYGLVVRFRVIYRF